jgi:hypothetical protein
MGMKPNLIFAIAVCLRRMGPDWPPYPEGGARKGLPESLFQNSIAGGPCQ